MKNSFVRVVFLFVLSSGLFSFSSYAAETYSFDSYHTNITWHANHFGFSHPSGKFTTIEGTLLLDEAKPENSKVDVNISPASITTGNEKFDSHLKSKDFLNVEKFPLAHFVSKKVTPTGKDTAVIEGTLTLVGVSKDITLDVKLNKIGEHPMLHKKTAGFSATTILKRSEFGINYALPAVADEVPISIEVEANIVQ